MVTNSLSRGGAERQTALWAEICESLGHSVEILVMHRREGEYSVPASTRVEHMGKTSRLDLPRMVRRVRALGRRVDVVVGFQSYVGLLCALARLPVPWLHVAGGDPRRLRDTTRMPRRLLRAVVRSAAVACAPTQGLVDCHRHLRIAPKSGGWLTVPNVADDNAFVAAPGERSGVLFVGRFRAEKNPLLALEVAMAAHARLTLLGWGPQQAELERAVAKSGYGDRVSIRSFTPAPWELYASHRALLMTSDYETFGNVIVESLAAGTPVVAADCDFGPREVLADAAYSHVVPQERGALITALRRVLDRPYSAEEAAECLRYAERYRASSLAPLIEEALQLTLSTSRLALSVAPSQPL